MSKDKVYKLKITIQDIYPAIWREVLVPGGITFHKLHKIIQAAFGWQDYHLFLFLFPDCMVKEQDPDFPLHEIEKNPKKTYIDDLFEKHEKCLYEYDFGDSWMHEIIVEEVIGKPLENRSPVCINGERHRPPEDVGGAGGYEYFLNVINDPNNPEYDEMLEWAEKDTGGRKFDPEYFYKNETNRKLKRIK
ncbi:plasmid pRiA4b ORF-3 family protein [Peribacillus cavernae]|nr:plasmid pRiA4b ORF-3 family protein [Peribacillus cavernae]MDQ0219186.1 hypothetical protein [Peribacillus cavernae]